MRATRAVKVLVVLGSALAWAGQPPVPTSAAPLGGATLLVEQVWQAPIEGAVLAVDPATHFMLTGVDNDDASAGFAGVDARTGQIRWERRYSGLDPHDWISVDISAGGMFLLRTTDPDQLWALRAADGALAWRRTIGAVTPAAYGGDTVLVPSGAELLALSLADGTLRWRWKPPVQCPVTSSLGGWRTFTVAVVCRYGNILYTVDASTAKPLWQLAGVGGYSAGGDWVLAYGRGWMRLYRTDGSQLYGSAENVTCGSPCLNLAGGVLIVGLDIDNKNWLRGVDAQTGRVLWNVRTQLGEMIGTRDQLYFTQHDYGGSVPGTVLTALDPRTGHTRSVALLTNASLEGADDTTGELTLSYRVEGSTNHWYAARLRPFGTDAPALLGGATQRRWPAACSLLSPGEAAAVIAGTRYRPVAKSLTDLDTALGTASTCFLQPDPAYGPVIRVTTVWCGTTSNQAERALDTLAYDDVRYSGTLPGLGDHAVALQYEGTEGVPPSMRIAVRVGRMVATVETLGGSDEQTVELARAIVRHLRAIGA